MLQVTFGKIAVYSWLSFSNFCLVGECDELSSNYSAKDETKLVVAVEMIRNGNN
jgi:hypothetical protein